jgi:hypothetical protein
MLPPGATNISMRGNFVDCPNCGLMAAFIDGTFDVAPNDILTLLAGPQFSADVLKAFSGLVEKAARNEISEQDLRTEVGKLDPDLAAILTAKNLKVAALLVVVLFIKSCNFETKLDLNRLYDQFTEHGTKKQITVSPVGKTEGTKHSETTSDSETTGKSPKKESQK